MSAKREKIVMQSRSDGGRRAGHHLAHHNAGIKIQLETKKSVISAALMHVVQIQNTLEIRVLDVPYARVDMGLIIGENSPQKQNITDTSAGEKIRQRE
jgi:hypothetical protein